MNGSPVAALKKLGNATSFFGMLSKKFKIRAFFPKVWQSGTDNSSNKLIVGANPVSLWRRFEISLLFFPCFLRSSYADQQPCF